MNTKALYAAIAVIALLIIGLFVYNQSQNNTELGTEQQTNTAATEDEVANVNTSTGGNTNTSTSNSGSQGQFSGEGDVAGKTYQIVFDGSKYTPANLTIKQGDTVVFKNESTKDFWPASAMHPDHLIYPEFDADKGIGAGGTYSFTFAKVGAWGFHDHLTPTAFGKITVQ